jgi:hypothetical protein
MNPSSEESIPRLDGRIEINDSGKLFGEIK